MALNRIVVVGAAAMGGFDALVFTGGIGENSSTVRELTCNGLDFIGVTLNPEKNKAASGNEIEITGDGSKVRVFVIPTNEELVIAGDTLRLVNEENNN